MAQGRYVSHHKAKLVTNDTISYGGIALGTETFEFSCFGQISSIKYKLFTHFEALVYRQAETNNLPFNHEDTLPSGRQSHKSGKDS